MSNYQESLKFKFIEYKENNVSSLFPNCCDFHSGIYKHLEMLYLNNEELNHLPDFIINHILYTEYLLTELINDKDWYLLITDYFEYIIYLSTLNVIPKEGLYCYMQSIKHYIENKLINNEVNKADLLISYLNDNYFDSKSKEKYSIDVIIKIYKKWINQFPFDILLFSEFKNEAIRKLKVGNNRKNIYHNINIVKLYSKDELIDKLNLLTIETLQKVDFVNKAKSGNLGNVEELEFELNSAKLKIELDGIASDALKDQMKFEEYLRKWLEMTTQYISNNKAKILELNKSDSNSVADLVHERNTSNVKINPKILVFKGSETISRVYDDLKGFFEGKEELFLKALNCEETNEKLLFPGNQNKFVEIFDRIKYNGFIISDYSSIIKWIIDNFHYRYKKGNVDEIRSFKETTLQSHFYKGLGVPPLKQRINIDWLQFKSYEKRRRDNNAMKF